MDQQEKKALETKIKKEIVKNKPLAYAIIAVIGILLVLLLFFVLKKVIVLALIVLPIIALIWWYKNKA